MILLGPQEDKGRGGVTQAHTCSAPGQSVRMDDGLGEFIASGLKASTLLLLACRFQNELTQFTKPPVTRLRIVIKEQFECHYTVTCCNSHSTESSKSDEKEKETSFKIPVVWGGQDLMETGKRE